MINALQKFVCALFGLLLALATSCLTLIYGWGMTPRSWLAILVFGFIGQVVAQCFISIAIAKEKPE